MDSFEDAWDAIVDFADAEPTVATLSRGNRNEIRAENDAIGVKNVDTQNWRTIEKEDFRYAYECLENDGEVTLDRIEPELAGEKSIILAILANALDLEYDKRPLVLYS